MGNDFDLLLIEFKNVLVKFWIYIVLHYNY